MQDFKEILQILHEEVVPAQGCTEPIAIAYVAAKAKEILKEEVQKVLIKVSGNIIKNVKSVVVPNSGGLTGIDTSAVMGIVAGKSKKGLMVISNITDKQMQEVKQFMKQKEIVIEHIQTDTKLYISITLYSKKHCSLVEIKHMHTNITRIERDKRVILERPCNDADFNSPLENRKKLSIKKIYELAKTLDTKSVEPLFEKVIELNCAIAKEGLDGKYGVNIGQLICTNIDKGVYGDDARNRAAAFASAGSDARMSGCALPVMTTSGSGNQGMSASLPLIKYAQITNISKEKLLRALFFSHLSTIHIKTNIGRLSAYCGVICATSSIAGALAFLNDESFEVVAHSIANSLGNVSGIICDGAKSSCAMKIATTTTAAFDSYMLASQGRYLHGGDGIIAQDIEQTLQNIGRLAAEGMNTTDKVIVDIMSKNKKS
jgi:L-cysteine desulfidase